MCLATKFKSLASKFLKIIRLICMQYFSLYECIISKSGSGAHDFFSSLLIEFLEARLGCHSSTEYLPVESITDRGFITEYWAC